jgi:hypothetical protein
MMYPHHPPADHADVREVEAGRTEWLAVAENEAGERDVNLGALRRGAHHLAQAANLWATAAEHWLAAGYEGEARRCAKAGVEAACAAAAALWTADSAGADPF